METRETLTARFDALQDQIMNLYEQGPTDLQSQITHWELERKSNVILYYARQEGYLSLGLQPTPALQVSEYRAKEAIHMTILLKSLAKSEFAKERWTLTDTSSQLLLTEPKNCFKKGPFQVEVLFDNDEQNTFPYPNWDHIYYQDADDKWHKTAGKVDYNGLYFEEPNGDRTYFKLFEKDAATYGRSGQWTVRYKKTIISAPVTSSSRTSFEPEAGGSSIDSETLEETDRTHRRSQSNTTKSPQLSPSTTTVSPRRRRRRSRERESSPRKRRRTEQSTSSTTIGAAPDADQVGRTHRSVDRHNLSRLARLQAEARDPPLIIVQGGSNALKCWRRRVSLKFGHLYLDSTTVFTWVRNHETRKQSSRILVAFDNSEQRATFLSTVTLPKSCSVSFGNLNRL